MEFRTAHDVPPNDPDAAERYAAERNHAVTTDAARVLMRTQDADNATRLIGYMQSWTVKK